MIERKSEFTEAIRDTKAPRPPKTTAEQRTSVEMPDRRVGNVWHPSKHAVSKKKKKAK
jgi:hypothetical protein